MKLTDLWETPRQTLGKLASKASKTARCVWTSLKKALIKTFPRSVVSRLVYKGASSAEVDDRTRDI